MRCGDAATAGMLMMMLNAASANAAMRTIRLTRVTLGRSGMGLVSHRFGQWAMRLTCRAIVNSRSAICRVLLEVPSGIHDIFAGSERALSPRKGDQMANWQDPQTTGVTAATVGVPRAARDVGLRSYMLSVYNYMASGVLLTGIVSMLLVNSPLIRLVFDPATGRRTFRRLIALFA